MLQDVADKQYKFLNENKSAFSSNVKNFWISMGGKDDIAYENGQKMLKELDKIGIKYYSYQGGHPVWRSASVCPGTFKYICISLQEILKKLRFNQKLTFEFCLKIINKSPIS
jgi:hypothetical protein